MTKRSVSRSRALPICAALVLAVGWGVHGARAGAAEPTPLLDQPIRRELAAGETHSYRVRAAAGEWLKVEVAQIGAELSVSVLDPSGGALVEAEWQHERQGAVEEAFFVAKDAGDYRVEVSAGSAPQDGGLYEIRITERRPASVDDQRRYEALRLVTEALRVSASGEAADLRRAEALVASALEAWHTLGPRVWEARSLMGLGWLRGSLGDWRGALEKYREVRALAAEIGDPAMQASSASSIATISAALGDARGAADMLLSLNADHRRHQDFGELCLGEGNLASLLSDLGDMQQALLHARAAVAACRDHLPRSLGTSLVHLGGVYLRAGLEQRALAAFAEAASAAPADDKNATTAALAGTGLALLSQGGPDGAREALDAFQRALAVAEAAGNPTWAAQARTGMGEALTRLGETASAIEQLNRAVETTEAAGDRSRLANALLQRGRAGLAAGRFEAAVADFQRALATSRESTIPDVEAAALHGLARSAAAQGRMEEALQRSEEAIGVAESLRATLLSQQSRAEYLSKRRSYYELAVEASMSLHAAHPDRGYDLRALRISERGRARSLLETLAARETAEPAADRPEVERPERELRDRINGQAARLRRLQQEKAPAEEVATAQREVEGLLDQAQELQGRRLREGGVSDPVELASEVASPAWRLRVLDERSVLLVYALGAHRSFVWAVSRDGFVSHELPARSVIEAETERFYRALAAREERPRFEPPDDRRRRVADADRDLPEAGRKLAGLLLEPVRHALEGRRLLVVADASLGRVPFALLPPSAADHRAARRASALREVQYLPSAAALAYWRLRASPIPAAKKTLLVFADPVFDKHDPRLAARTVVPAEGIESDWRFESTRAMERAGLVADGGIPRLVYTAAEARALVALVPPGQSRVALGFDASRAAALGDELASYRFVHFATHAFVDETSPDLSSVVLSLVDREGREVDGFLRAEDASRMHLHAELVTLSGCSTGLGKDVRGEGTLGLARAFLSAGARRVLVSLWDVDDRATAALMSQLYRGMLGPKRLSPGAALREAQAAVRADARWSAPYYWAGFVLIGDPGEL